MCSRCVASGVLVSCRPDIIRDDKLCDVHITDLYEGLPDESLPGLFMFSLVSNPKKRISLPSNGMKIYQINVLMSLGSPEIPLSK